MRTYESFTISYEDEDLRAKFELPFDIDLSTQAKVFQAILFLETYNIDTVKQYIKTDFDLQDEELEGDKNED